MADLALQDRVRVQERHLQRSFLPAGCTSGSIHRKSDIRRMGQPDVGLDDQRQLDHAEVSHLRRDERRRQLLGTEPAAIHLHAGRDALWQCRPLQLHQRLDPVDRPHRQPTGCHRRLLHPVPQRLVYHVGTQLRTRGPLQHRSAELQSLPLPLDGRLRPARPRDLQRRVHAPPVLRPGRRSRLLGGVANVTCGHKWYLGGWDGSAGVGQQMAALEVFQGLLASPLRSSNVTPPFVGSTVVIAQATPRTTVPVPTGDPRPLPRSDRPSAGVAIRLDLYLLVGMMVLAGVVLLR